MKLEIEAGAHKLETLLGTTIDKNFDKMEVFALRSIVAIPDDLEDWIRLPHYEVCLYVGGVRVRMKANGFNRA